MVVCGTGKDRLIVQGVPCICSAVAGIGSSSPAYNERNIDGHFTQKDAKKDVIQLLNQLLCLFVFIGGQ